MFRNREIAINSSSPATVGVLVTIAQALSFFLILSAFSLKYGVVFVGDFSYLNSILLVTSILFTCGFRSAYVLENDSFGHRTFYVLRCLGTCLLIIASFLIISTTRSDLLSIYWPLTVYRALEMLLDIQWARYQIDANLKAILLSQAGRYLLTAVVVVTLAWLNFEPMTAIWAYALSGVAIVFCYDLPRIRRALSNDTLPLTLIQCLRTCFPIGLNLTATSVQQNSVRIFLGYFAGSAALGLFSIAYQIFSMLNMAFVSGLNFYLKKDVDTKDRLDQVKVLYTIIAITSLVFLCGWWIAGKYFLITFFGEAYLSIFMPTMILLFGLVFRFLGYSHQWLLLKRGSYNRLAIHQMMIAILTTLLTALLVYSYRLDGAYMALIFSSISYFCYMLVLERNTVKVG